MDKDMQPAHCKLQAAARDGEDRLGDDAGDEQATDGRCSGLWEQRPMLSWNYRPGQSHKP